MIIFLNHSNIRILFQFFIIIGIPEHTNIHSIHSGDNIKKIKKAETRQN